MTESRSYDDIERQVLVGRISLLCDLAKEEKLREQKQNESSQYFVATLSGSDGGSENGWQASNSL